MSNVKQREVYSSTNPCLTYCGTCKRLLQHCPCTLRSSRQFCLLPSSSSSASTSAIALAKRRYTMSFDCLFKHFQKAFSRALITSASPFIDRASFQASSGAFSSSHKDGFNEIINNFALSLFAPLARFAGCGGWRGEKLFTVDTWSHTHNE